MKPVILVTGFGPYPRVPRNPTDRLARDLAASARLRRLGLRIEPHVFETSYAAVRTELPALLARLQPAACLHLGLAPRASRIRIETRGENRARVLFPDASGRIPDRRLHAEGPAAIRLVARPAELLRLLGSRGFRAEISRDAGGYLCNALAYESYAAARVRGPARPTVFIHLPRLAIASQKRDLQRALEDVVISLARLARPAELSRGA